MGGEAAQAGLSCVPEQRGQEITRRGNTRAALQLHGRLLQRDDHRWHNRTIGISAIALALSTAPESIVSIRGKDKFVAMDLAHYHYLRECELDAALAETRADLVAGQVTQVSPSAHLKRLDKL